MKVLCIARLEQGFDVVTEDGIIPFVTEHAAKHAAENEQLRRLCVSYPFDMYMLIHGMEPRKNTLEGEIAATRQT